MPSSLLQCPLRLDSQPIFACCEPPTHPSTQLDSEIDFRFSLLSVIFYVDILSIYLSIYLCAHTPPLLSFPPLSFFFFTLTFLSLRSFAHSFIHCASTTFHLPLQIAVLRILVNWPALAPHHLSYYSLVLLIVLSRRAACLYIFFDNFLCARSSTCLFLMYEMIDVTVVYQKKISVPLYPLMNSFA